MGKRSIIINYPTSYPANLKDGWQIGGYGLHLNEFRRGTPKSTFNLDNLAEHFLISTEDYPFGNRIEFRKATGWQGVEHSAKALEAQVTPVLRKTLRRMEPFSWYLLLDDVGGKGYDTLYVSKSKQKADVLANLHAGEWTPHIYDTFLTEEGPKDAVFRMKLLELSPDGQIMRLFIPSIPGFPEPCAK